MFRIATALGGLSLLALAGCAGEATTKNHTSYSPRAELERAIAPPPSAAEVTMSSMSSRYRLAAKASSKGRASYICTPAGFGQRSRCFSRN